MIESEVLTELRLRGVGQIVLNESANVAFISDLVEYLQAARDQGRNRSRSCLS